jgi:hypothetical protein
MKFTTKEDVRTYVANSGPGMWDDDCWGGRSSCDGWIEWLWSFMHHAPIDEKQFQICLASYLRSVDEDPADYSLDESGMCSECSWQAPNCKYCIHDNE